MLNKRRENGPTFSSFCSVSIVVGPDNAPGWCARARHTRRGGYNRAVQSGGGRGAENPGVYGWCVHTILGCVLQSHQGQAIFLTHAAMFCIVSSPVSCLLPSILVP